jgi:hypothetical protein
MMDSGGFLHSGDKLRNAVKWICEALGEGRDRKEVLIEAEFKFDLNPLECEFLNSKFLCENTEKN